MGRHSRRAQWLGTFDGGRRPGVVSLQRGVLPEELPVPLGDGAGAVDADQVCIIWVGFQDNPSLGPEPGTVASLVLVLDTDMVAWLEWRKLSGTLGQLLLLGHPPPGVSHLPLLGGKAPLLSGEELARLEGQEVTQDAAIHNLCWAQASHRAGCIPVLQEGPGQVIRVKCASLGSITPDQPLGRLYSHLGPLVGPGVVGCTDPVDNPKLVAEGFQLPGGEDLGPVTGEHNRDAEDGHIGPEDIDHLLASVPLQLEHGEPPAEAVHDGEVCVGSDGEEVGTDGLKGVAGLIRDHRGHGRVAGLVLGTAGAGRGVIDEVHAEVRPV